MSKVLGNGPARVQALKAVNLSLDGGQLTLLMGPSGSGKTTLLSMLGCMLAPTDGTVRIRGSSTGEPPASSPRSGGTISDLSSNPITCFHPDGRRQCSDGAGRAR